jgi:integrase
MVGYLPNGTPDRRTVSGTTRQEVQKQLRELLRRTESGLLGEKEKERDTVITYLIGWLEGIPGTVKASTVVRYRPIVYKHLIPAFGKKKLADLKPDAIQALYAVKVAAGLSPTTVRLIHTTLHKALEDAVEYGYLGANLASRAKPPRRAEFEPYVLSGGEVHRVLSVAEETGDRLAGLWALLAATGAREGELLALTWDGVWWERSAI